MASSLGGPKKIIELDDVPNSGRIDKKAVHLWKGKLWTVIKFGCCQCIEDKDSVTFAGVNDDSHECSVHGELIEVPYLLTKDWVLKIGDKTESGQHCTEDAILFPASMPKEERDNLVVLYIQNAVAAVSKSIAMDDEEGDEDDD